MCAEELVEAIERRVLEGHPREIDHARKRHTLVIRNFRDVEMIVQRGTEGVREPFETVRDVGRDSL